MDRSLVELLSIDNPTTADVLEASLPIEGWTYPEELAALFELAKPCRRVVELGVWKGRTTIALAMGCRGVVYACDHWRGSADELDGAHNAMATPDGRAECFAKAMANLSPLVGRGRVVIVQADHKAAARVVEALAGVEACDLVFVDGGHDEPSVTRDIATASRLVAPGGVIAGHDFTWPGVANAVRKAFGRSFATGPGSLWRASR